MSLAHAVHLGPRLRLSVSRAVERRAVRLAAGGVRAPERRVVHVVEHKVSVVLHHEANVAAAASIRARAPERSVALVINHNVAVGLHTYSTVSVIFLVHCTTTTDFCSQRLQLIGDLI